MSKNNPNNPMYPYFPNSTPATNTNTVTISLEDYIQLYEFRKRMEEGKILITPHEAPGIYNYRLCGYYITGDAIEEIKKIVELSNEKLKEDYDELSHRNSVLVDDNTELTEKVKELSKLVPSKLSPTVEDFEGMSVKEFKKFKKQQKIDNN